MNFTHRVCRGLFLYGLSAFAVLSAQPPDSLSLERALAGARNHPHLAALAVELRAREALENQAGRIANPRLSLEAENFAGSGPFAGTDALETTARFEQAVEWGGKRSLRKDQAGADRRLGREQLKIREREVAREVRDAFFKGLELQARTDLLKKDITILRELTEAAKRRKEAGGGAVAEELKLRLHLSQAQLDSGRAAGELESLRVRLAALAGEAGPAFTALKGNLAHRLPLPSWDSVSRGLDRHPALALAGIEKEQQTLAVRAARKENYPDLDLNAGVRRLSGGEGEWALVGGVSLPLPLWNRDAGEVRGANFRVQRSALEAQAVRAELASRAFTLWNSLQVKTREMELLEKELLPEAEKARAASQAAYAAGRFGVSDLMDGQRIWLEMNQRYLAVLGEYQREANELEALAGASLL
jgi:cobalt-zinc-cadmium efflux system outer membrane protein